jgi:hypothetical protein
VQAVENFHRTSLLGGRGGSDGLATAICLG